MTTTSTGSTSETGETRRPPATQGGGLDAALAEAEKSLTRLVQDLHTAARGSAAFEGAERDAKRLLSWMDEKTRNLRGELDKLGKDVGSAGDRILGKAKSAGAAAESKSETVKGLRLDTERLKERLETTVRRKPEEARETPAPTDP